jgi:hypothetical protein
MQLIDGATCGPGKNSGLPSLPIPSLHLTEGIPDTDMIVYLSLEFVNFNTTNSTTDNPEVPMNATTINATSICSGDSLAAASFCSTDQYDRPTAALLHICVDGTFFYASKRQRNVLTLMHELGHALGFNALSMAHFRHPDGSPYTPRTPEGDIPDSTIECTGLASKPSWATVALPSQDILQFRTVRGGVRVAELVTPSIVQVVRNQFDCQFLTGAELESGEGLPLAGEGQGCIGDHWERRLFSSDLMNPVIDDVEYSTRISTLTLAYFADSGWYQVDLSNAQVAAGWGRGAGCPFVNDACIEKNGEVPVANADFFCNEIPTIQSRSTATEIHGCTPDLSRKAVCSIGQYDLDLPSEYQYFNLTYGSDVGGDDPFMDYCPVYSGFDNGLCSSLENEQYVKANAVERYGERNSRCLVGSIHPHENSKTALCLPIACVIEDRTLRVKLDRVWHLCSEAGQQLQSGDVTVDCPDPRRICPTFYCPYDCLGTGGVCDYNSGKCLCEYESEDSEETAWQVCGLAEENGEPSKNSFGPFLRPVEHVNDKAIPHPDSPLSDYYVPTARSLEETKPRLLEPWAIAVVAGVAGFVLLSSALFGFFWRRGKRQEPETNHHIHMGMNRNKDKMLAAVLVDMRIHESLAETDEHLSESEANVSERSLETSSRRSETLSEADISQEDIIIVEEEEEDDIEGVTEGPQLIRRRRVVTDMQQQPVQL